MWLANTFAWTRNTFASLATTFVWLESTFIGPATTIVWTRDTFTRLVTTFAWLRDTFARLATTFAWSNRKYTWSNNKYAWSNTKHTWSNKKYARLATTFASSWETKIMKKPTFYLPSTSTLGRGETPITPAQRACTLVLNFSSINLSSRQKTAWTETKRLKYLLPTVVLRQCGFSTRLSICTFYEL